MAGSGRAGSSPSLRLRRSQEVRRVLREGTKVRGRRMVLYVAPGQEPARAGFVSSRRIGGAVVRNRARRQMREAWRSMAGSVDGTFDLVFAARPDILGAKTQDLAEEMRASLVSAGVLNR